MGEDLTLFPSYDIFTLKRYHLFGSSVIGRRTDTKRFIYKGVSKLKTTGVVRKLDELGRITLPIELRRSLNLDPKDELEIFVEDDQIILRKCESGDIFTGGTEDLIEYEGKTVSKHSIVEMAKIAGLSVTE